MSGTITLPGSISIEQSVVVPEIEVTQAPRGPVLPPGVPVYPLASDPGQTWDLQDVNGVLTWVLFTAPPGQTALGLESGDGAIALEDGAGVLLLES